ncbi:MAG TPA: diguanylate cyclase [Chloroflexota bacterium]|nr:diguanylate cyclase [Chloroflexota bacterium]
MTLTMIPSADALTGLLSPTAFRERLDRAIVDEETVSLALIDLDRFKELNDSHGHKAGDELLRSVGERLSRLAQDTSGAAGRLGGDEFAVLLPDVSLESAFLRLERFRSDVAAEAGLIPTVPDYRLSLSVGLATFPRDAQSAPDLLSRADQALWSAKQAGRNAVALPTSEEMVLKTCHYTKAQLGRLKNLAEMRGIKEAALLREALDDLLRKYDVR